LGNGGERGTRDVGRVNGGSSIAIAATMLLAAK
jgi:hypothetical protein